jgi:hypothetical protein
LHADALTQCVFQRHRAVVLLEQVPERLVGKLLQGPHAVERQLMQRVPGRGFKGDALRQMGESFI